MKYQINLFPPRNKNIADRAVYFSFNYLRYILVLTQMVVILVFFYRFQVDQEIVDLRESVVQKGEIISVSEPLLKDIAALERRSSAASDIVLEQGTFQKVYQYFFRTFPSELFLTQLNFTDTGVHMEGYSQNIQIIRAYIARLQDEKRFTAVQLEYVKRQDFQYLFALHLQGFIGP